MTLYGYVHDSNGWIDVLGLSKQGGGSHKETRLLSLGGEVNHMPAFASYKNIPNIGIAFGEGTSTWMEILDHRDTASWGNSKKSKIWKKVQEDLILRGKFGKAMEMDIKDVKRKFGTKYNQGMREMIDYAKDKGFITNKEANRLKRKYVHH